MKRFVTIFLLIVFFSSSIIKVRADLNNDIDQLGKDIEALRTELSGKQANYQKLKTQLEGIKTRVGYLETEIVRKQKEVIEGEQALDYQKKLLNERAKNYYKNISKNTVSLINLLVEGNLSRSLDNFFYQKTVVDEDRKTIIKVVLYIKNLEEKKKALEEEKTKLASLKIKVDKQAEILSGEITQTQQKIATLTARQQTLIAQKLASLNIPRSAGTSLRGCVDDRGTDPGFSPRFAFFTYGAPHRNGLNQYGAWGRAKAGQNEEKILQEYYPNMSLKKDYDQNAQVVTTTGWSGSIEDYVQRIYEVPDSWTDNNLAVLKAQAVAARSYALNVMQRNGSICTTESCQVFKDQVKGGNWEQAVNATRGWVLMDGDKPGFTQYASTHGGYILNLGKFDGKDGSPSNFNELNDRAYDKDSPWFYCDWGSRSQYSNTAWMKPSELVDIVNVILLARKDSSARDHLYQTDKAHPYGGEIWNEERVKQELGAAAYNNISSVSIGVDFGSGKTTSVNVSGDGKSDSFSGDEFKNWFNLRAPANIQIVGPLFNVEQK